MTRYNYFQYGYLNKLSLIPYYLFLLDHLDSDFLPFTFHLEDGKRCSQPHSVEYDWLGPYLTQNTQGRYILILPVVLMTPTRMLYP